MKTFEIEAKRLIKNLGMEYTGGQWRLPIVPLEGGTLTAKEVEINRNGGKQYGGNYFEAIEKIAVLGEDLFFPAQTVTCAKRMLEAHGYKVLHVIAEEGHPGKEYRRVL